MAAFNIAIIVGSNRRESLNRKLAQALTRLAPPTLEFTRIRIDDLPMFSQDLEGAPPPAVIRLKAEIAQAAGLLFVTPEHNRSLPAVLKNAIDWAARPRVQNAWAGKPAAITGTSPGTLGTAMGQLHLRQILNVVGVLVMPGEAYVTFRPDLISDDGHISDDTIRALLQAHIGQFAGLVQRFAG
jgi:chromate reductase